HWGRWWGVWTELPDRRPAPTVAEQSRSLSPPSGHIRPGVKLACSGLPGQISPIHGVVRPRYEGRPVGAEKADHLSDFVGLAEPPHRMLRHEHRMRFGVVLEILDHRSSDESRSHGVDAEALLGV